MRGLQATLVILSCVSSLSAYAQEAVANVDSIWADAGRHEVTVYPVFVDLNASYTREAGSSLGWTWHLTEGFAVQTLFAYGWGTVLQDYDPSPAGPMTYDVLGPPHGRTLWTGMAGVELTPAAGAVMLWKVPSTLELVLNSGIGVAETRHTPSLPVLYSEAPFDFPWMDTGLHATAGVGLGARMKVSDALAFRLEVRDLVRSQTIKSVNGCDLGELELLDDASRGGNETAPEGISDTCRDGGLVGSDSVPLAYNLARNPGGGLKHTVSFTLGASLTF